MTPHQIDPRTFDPKHLAVPALAFAGGALLGLMGFKTLLRGAVAAATVVGLVQRAERGPADAHAGRRTPARAARRRSPTKRSA